MLCDHYKATVIKTLGYWQRKKKDRSMEQHAEPRNRPTWSTDHDREQRQNCRERTVFSNMALEQLASTSKKNET